jgi:hypothetical protein
LKQEPQVFSFNCCRKKYYLPDLENLKTSELLLGSFEIERIPEKKIQNLRFMKPLIKISSISLKLFFTVFFASIPYEWRTRNNLASYEGFYASIVYAYFAASGLNCTVEDSTSKGKLDMAVFYKNRAYLFEFKVVELEPEGKALEQIKQKKYEERYRGKYEEIYLIGIEFSAQEKNVVLFEWDSFKKKR